MRMFEENPYYNPGACGLKLIDSIDFADSYEFDIVAVWEDIETGQRYYASDTGCSCPTPFEDFRSLSDMNPLNGNTMSEFKEFVNGRTDYRGQAREREVFLSQF